MLGINWLTKRRKTWPIKKTYIRGTPVPGIIAEKQRYVKDYIIVRNPSRVIFTNDLYLFNFLCFFPISSFKFNT